MKEELRNKSFDEQVEWAQLTLWRILDWLEIECGDTAIVNDMRTALKILDPQAYATIQ